MFPGMADSALQAFFAADGWFPVEERLRQSNVRLSNFWVVCRHGSENDFACTACKGDNFPGNIQYRDFVGITDVHGLGYIT